MDFVFRPVYDMNDYLHDRGVIAKLIRTKALCNRSRGVIDLSFDDENGQEVREEDEDVDMEDEDEDEDEDGDGDGDEEEEEEEEEKEEENEEEETDYTGNKVDTGTMQDQSDTKEEDDHITDPAETQHVSHNPDQPLDMLPVTSIDPPIHPQLHLDAHIAQAKRDLEAGKDFGSTYIRGFQYTALGEIEKLEKEIRLAMERIIRLEAFVRKYEYVRQTFDTVEERPRWFKDRMKALERQMPEYKALLALI
jgi:hypothetical protein